MKLLFLYIFLPAAFFSFTLTAQAQKIAMVDLDSVMAHMPGAKKIQQQLDSIANASNQALNSMLSQLFAGLIDSSAYKTMSGEGIKKKQQEITALKQRINDFQRNAHENLRKNREKLWAPLKKKATEASIRVAKKNGYKVLITKSRKESTMIYSGQEPTDITNLVIGGK